MPRTPSPDTTPDDSPDSPSRGTAVSPGAAVSPGVERRTPSRRTILVAAGGLAVGAGTVVLARCHYTGPGAPRLPWEPEKTIAAEDFDFVAEDPSTHRPAIQAALDHAKDGDIVHLGPHRWVLTSKTAPWEGEENLAASHDRILVKPPGVNLVGDHATLVVGDRFGPYGAVLGTERDSLSETGCRIAGVTIDYNARGGNAARAATLSAWPQMGVRLLGTEDTELVVDVTHHDADNINCVYVSAHSLTIPQHRSTDTGLHAVERHDHSTYYCVTLGSGGQQQWGPGSHTGGGLGSRTAVEIHGGSVMMEPFSVTRYVKAANLCGFGEGTEFHRVPVTGRELLGGVMLWSRAERGGINHVDLKLDLAMDSRWYSGPLNSLITGAVTLHEGNDVPVGELVVRGTATFAAPERRAGAARRYSCGFLARTASPDGGVTRCDIDADIVTPGSAGMWATATLGGGSLVLRVTDPGGPAGSPSNLPRVYRAWGMLDGRMESMDLTAMLTETRSGAETVQTPTMVLSKCLFVNSTLTGTVSVTGDATTDEVASTMPPFVWPAPPATMAGGLVATMRGPAPFPDTAEWAILGEGSTYTDTSSGTTYAQAHPTGGRAWAVSGDSG